MHMLNMNALPTGYTGSEVMAKFKVFMQANHNANGKAYTNTAAGGSTIALQTFNFKTPVFHGMHVAQANAKCDRWTDRLMEEQTDGRKTKRSQCGALLRWRHKNLI